jgi:ABC-type uncharacterized transport system substrate-binding protein
METIMATSMRTLVLFAGLTLTAMVGAMTLDAFGASGKRVLIVQSYDPDYVWTQQINQGVLDGLQASGNVVEILYLDAKRAPEPEKLRAASIKILARIEALAPEVVIAVDDAAQVYLVAPRLKGRKTPQVVFCGVNAPLEKYGFPAENVSGVRERWHFRQGFALIKRMIPSVKRVAVLVEDSESGAYVIDDLWEDFQQNGPFALEVAGAEKIATFQQWRERVSYYQAHADVLAPGLYNTLLDKRSGQVTPPDEVMAWTNAENRKPTLGFSDVAKKHGVLCGILESGYEQGLLAGAMAREILTTGKDAGRLPVRINLKGVVMVNLKTAEKLALPVPFEIIEAAGEVLR